MINADQGGETAPFADGQLQDIKVDEAGRLQNGHQGYIHRVLRHQLNDKLDEIAEGLGLTKLQMMEAVAHWMQHTARELCDAETELEQT